MENRKLKPVIYGALAGFGVLLFYIGVLSLFQGNDFAFSQFSRLWYWIIPLAAGFGTQIGLYTSIASAASGAINAEVAASGTVSGGSMVACCSHFLLNIIPIVGLSGLAAFLMTY